MNKAIGIVLIGLLLLVAMAVRVRYLARGP